MAKFTKKTVARWESAGSLAALAASVALTGCFGETVSNFSDLQSLCRTACEKTCATDCAAACEEVVLNTGGGSGTDCVGIIECINASGGAQSELEACIAEGTPRAQHLIIAVLTCRQTNCADVAGAEFASCRQEFCSAELTECTYAEGPPDPTGSETCSGVVDCLLTCRDDACANECLGEADSSETQCAAIEFHTICGGLHCAMATSADEFVACVAESCPDEAAACP